MSLALAIVDTDQHVLANQAVRHCLAQMNFDEVLVFTDLAEAFPGLPTVAVHELARIGDYNNHITRTLAQHMKSDHVLIVQYDGFILDSTCFEPAFLDCDYIGAPWPGAGEHRVGNGGFSLRSRRLVEAVARLPYDTEAEAEDLFIARTARPLLERHAGCRFASVEMAQRFSVEYPLVPHPTFGFHGIFNLPAVYRNDIGFLMRHLSHRVLSARANYLLPGLTQIGPEAVALLWQRLAPTEIAATDTTAPA